MRERARTSSGPMCTNCDDVQHPVQVPQGTATAEPPFCALMKSPSQVEKRPAGKSGATVWRSVRDVHATATAGSARLASVAGKIAPVPDGVIQSHIGQAFVQGGSEYVVFER